MRSNAPPKIKPSMKSLHLDISRGRKNRARRAANFTSPAPKPKNIAIKPIEKMASELAR
jgi:hypothetical protein